MNGETREISGWFSAGGEWVIFSSGGVKKYNPYTE